jgi:membrane glycosyltransferase
MSPTLPPPSAAESPTTAPRDDDQLWALARERVAAYLEAAGLDRAAADDAAPQLLAEVQGSVRPASPEDAALAALRAARRALAQQAAWAERSANGQGTLAPAGRPLSMPRRSLRSVIDWRLAASVLRRLLPARAPRRVRRQQPPAAAQTVGGGRSGAGAAAPARLSLQARRRRLGFLALISLTTLWGVSTFVKILGVDGLSPLDLAHTGVFAILMLWLAQSFWTLAAGATVLARRLRLPPAPTPPVVEVAGEPPPRTALVVPIYNEDTTRVFAALRAMWEGLAALPEGERCDLFVLSDTTDPDIWLAEIDAWQEMRGSVPGGERVFYRRRLRNVKRKTGNIEDFVTRWGGAYAYILVLDADSIMAAGAMAELVRAWTRTRTWA